jgi:predicted metalloprotease
MQGHVVPESFTHGSAQQRMAWFKRGLESGSVQSCDTFNSRS